MNHCSLATTAAIIHWLYLQTDLYKCDSVTKGKSEDSWGKGTNIITAMLVTYNKGTTE